MKRSTIRSIAAALAVAATTSLLLPACGSARRGEPLTREPVAEPSALVQEGHRLFDTFCNSCHPGGTAGIGLALNNKPLPEAAIRFQVRNGIGAMPAFDEKTISDEQLDAIIEYIDWVEDLEVERDMETEDGY